MTTTVSYVLGSELPSLEIAWLDADGDVIDFSTGWTFSLKLASRGAAATITKTTGITGAATSPNVTVAWATTGDLNGLSAGRWTGQLTATRTADSKQRIMQFALLVGAAVT